MSNINHNNYNSCKNQAIKGKFVEREVYANVNGMVEYILQNSYNNTYDNVPPFTQDDVENFYFNNEEKIEELEGFIHDRAIKIRDLEQEENTEELIEELENQIKEAETEISELENEQENPPEVFEWYLVSDWLCEKLKEKGEVVISSEGIWGRCTCGQAILLDHVISEICDDLNLLED